MITLDSQIIQYSHCKNYLQSTFDNIYYFFLDCCTTELIQHKSILHSLKKSHSQGVQKIVFFLNWMESLRISSFLAVNNDHSPGSSWYGTYHKNISILFIQLLGLWLRRAVWHIWGPTIRISSWLMQNSETSFFPSFIPHLQPSHYIFWLDTFILGEI